MCLKERSPRIFSERESLCLRRRWSLSQKEIGHYFLVQGRQRLSQKEVVTNSRRSCLFIFSERDWLCHKERRSLSRGDFASLLFMKRLLSLSERGCFCLRENDPLRFREQLSFPQKEIVVVEMASVSGRETVLLCFREKFSLSQKEDVCFSRRDRLSCSPREIVFV